MTNVRYRIVQDLPDEVRSARFCDLGEEQIRLRVSVDGDEVVVIATGLDTAACEALLRGLGAEEIGVDLCG